MENTFNRFGAAHADTSDRALDWDDLVTADNAEEYEVLKPGTYPFIVTKFERRQFRGSDKMPPCPQAVITVRIDGGEQGIGYATTNFFLTQKQAWKIARFFVSLGIMKKGETGAMDWNKVKGASGMLELDNREYKGNMYNEVKKWLSPEEHDQPSPSAATYHVGTF